MPVEPAYREWAPPPDLAEAVACLWTHRISGAFSGTVLPDGCTDLIWRQGAGAFVAGPDTGPVTNDFPAGTNLVGLRFRPGAGAAGLGLPLDEILDQRVPAVELSPATDAALRPDLSPAEAIDAMTVVAANALDAAALDPAVSEAVTLLADPARRLDEVRAATGISERQLRRRFHAAVGYGPKTLQRVLRFRSFLDRVDRGDDLATAAAQGGFADQPHLNRECRDLAGMTPAELAASRG